MIQFICYFFPAFIALKFDGDNGESQSILDVICKYTLYVVAINGVVYAILYLFTAHRYRYFSLAHFNVSFALQYIIVSVILAGIIPVILKFIKAHISVDVSVSRK